VYCDSLEFISSEAYSRNHPRLTRALHWNMVAPLMDRAIRDLRDDDAPGASAGSRRTS